MQAVRLSDLPIGEVAERLNAPVSKTGMASGSSRVRIPPSPLSMNARGHTKAVGVHVIAHAHNADTLPTSIDVFSPSVERFHVGWPRTVKNGQDRSRTSNHPR